MPSALPPDRSKALDIASVPVALLAGGLATRLRPITAKIPKSLVEVAGRPFIDHQLELLRANGVRRVVLCLGHLGEMVRDHVGGGSAFGVEVAYSFDGERLLGTGGALKRAEALLGPVFWVLYGDSYLEIDYRDVLADFGRRDAAGLMTVLENKDRWDRSNVIFRNGRLVWYSKRAPSPEMTHIDYGALLLGREVVDRVPAGEPHDLADLLSDLSAEGRLAGYEVHSRFYEIGSPAGLAETQAYLQAKVA
jgi:NDP-sugar pyrophosphorylase family protein